MIVQLKKGSQRMPPRQDRFSGGRTQDLTLPGLAVWSPPRMGSPRTAE